MADITTVIDDATKVPTTTALCPKKSEFIDALLKKSEWASKPEETPRMEPVPRKAPSDAE